MYMMKDFVEIVGCAPPPGLKVDSGVPHLQFGIEEVVNLPPAKPDIEQLVKLMMEVEITDHRIISTVLVHDCKPIRKVVIEGVIHQKILYVAAKPEQPVHAAHFDFPFCNFIELPECFDPCKIHGVKIICEDANLKLINPRTIKKCLILLAWLDIPHPPCPEPQPPCHDPYRCC